MQGSFTFSANTGQMWDILDTENFLHLPNLWFLQASASYFYVKKFKSKPFFKYIKINCRSSSQMDSGVNRWESDFPEHCARPCWILHLVLQPVSSKALSLFITSCLLWSYLRATFEPRASWSWISAYNPSQKLIVLWHPAGLFSPRNLRPQFPGLSLDVP